MIRCSCIKRLGEKTQMGQYDVRINMKRVEWEESFPLAFDWPQRD